MVPLVVLVVVVAVVVAAVVVVVHFGAKFDPKQTRFEPLERREQIRRTGGICIVCFVFFLFFFLSALVGVGRWLWAPLAGPPCLRISATGPEINKSERISSSPNELWARPSSQPAAEGRQIISGQLIATGRHCWPAGRLLGPSISF